MRVLYTGDRGETGTLQGIVAVKQDGAPDWEESCKCGARTSGRVYWCLPSFSTSGSRGGWKERLCIDGIQDVVKTDG